LNHDIYKENRSIFLPDAVIKPNAVMVESSNAKLAIVAMLHSYELVFFAKPTKFLLDLFLRSRRCFSALES
jgi:hypothetical protein